MPKAVNFNPKYQTCLELAKEVKRTDPSNFKRSHCVALFVEKADVKYNSATTYWSKVRLELKDEKA